MFSGITGKFPSKRTSFLPYSQLSEYELVLGRGEGGETYDHAQKQTDCQALNVYTGQNPRRRVVSVKTRQLRTICTLIWRESLSACLYLRVSFYSGVVNFCRYVFVCLPVCLSACLSVCLCVRLSAIAAILAITAILAIAVILAIAGILAIAVILAIAAIPAISGLIEKPQLSCATLL